MNKKAVPPLRVSIIIPAYDHAKYIEEAIESALAQEMPGIEIIVVDDGSVDDTAERASAILAGQQEFAWHMIQKQNQGAHAAINQGISMARGEWIAILNSDDRFTPSRVSRLLELAEQTGSRFVISRVAHVDEHGQPLAETTPHRYYYNWSVNNRELYPTPNFELLRHNYAITTGNFFFHRSLIETIGPFRDFKICHDWDFLLRALLTTEISFLDETLYEYRVHPKNTINPSVDDLRYREMDALLSNYLENAESATNPLAPCFKNWGSYWVKFVSSEIPFGYLPKTAEVIREIQSRSISSPPALIDPARQELISGAMYRSQRMALRFQEELLTARKTLDGHTHKSLFTIIRERIKGWFGRIFGRR